MGQKIVLRNIEDNRLLHTPPIHDLREEKQHVGARGIHNRRRLNKGGGGHPKVDL